MAAAETPLRPRTITLRDGRRARLRAARPEDAGEIVQAFERLSAPSCYQRFMQHKRELDPRLVGRGLHPAPGSQFARMATIPAADGTDIVGGARSVPAQAPATCEYSMTVAEEWRRACCARCRRRRCENVRARIRRAV